MDNRVRRLKGEIQLIQITFFHALLPELNPLEFFIYSSILYLLYTESCRAMASNFAFGGSSSSFGSGGQATQKAAVTTSTVYEKLDQNVQSNFQQIQCDLPPSSLFSPQAMHSFCLLAQ